jgi:hypothetical protein
MTIKAFNVSVPESAVAPFGSEKHSFNQSQRGDAP